MPSCLSLYTTVTAPTLPQAGKVLPTAVRVTVSELGPKAQAVIESFGIPDHLVAAPIAGDWERYNRVDNKGELIGEAAKA